MTTLPKTFCYFILQITLLLSVLFLFRGHNHPGGGFIGALVACTGFGFYLIVFKSPPPFIKHKHVQLIIAGTTCLVISIFMPVFLKQAMLTGLWLKINIFGEIIKIGTPLLFDLGIYLCILGSVLSIITYLEEDACG